jgi:two-component system response regulator QseB
MVRPGPEDADSGLVPANRPRLLLVEDDRALTPLLMELLSADHDVEHAADGHVGLHLGLTHTYDVIVLDRGLPVIEGLDLLARFRTRGIVTPVLILTARGMLADRVEGLDAGAEDYLGKPFEIDELLARLRALLRRHADRSPTLAVGTRHMDVQSRTVSGAGRTVELSGREAELLAVLARRPAKVFTRPELLSAVFAPEDSHGTVDTYVYYLRKKLGRNVIRTVHGSGYRIGSE